MTRPDLTVLARIRSSAVFLSPSEAKVAGVILANPEEVVEWSTAQLALRADTATATVIRACQSLGFRGFQHLRLELERSTPLLPREQDDIVSGAFMTVCTGRTVTNLRDLRQGELRPLLRHLRTRTEQRAL